MGDVLPSVLAGIPGFLEWARAERARQFDRALLEQYPVDTLERALKAAGTPWSASMVALVAEATTSNRSLWVTVWS